MFRKIVIALLTFAMVLSPMTAYAETSESAPQEIVYSSEDFSFTKISHPDKPQATSDGIVDYIGNGVVTSNGEGQGDRGQSYSWSAIGYGDDIYIGTCYAAMGSTLTLMGNVLGDQFDKETMAATLKAMFNGTFFYGQEDGVDSNGILVKLNTKTAEVKLIMSKSHNNVSPQFRNAIEYHDKLYFCGAVNDNGSGGLPSIYEIDPKDDSFRLVHRGMTMQEFFQSYKQGICTSIRGMAVFHDQLIVSCVGVNGPYIMITDDPENGFTTIATQEDLFDYPAYHFSDSIYGGSIWEMAVFNDSLYVSLCTGTPDNKPDANSMQSFAIVRGNMNADGTFTWTPVVGNQEKDGAKYTFGIDPERTRAGAGVFQVFGDYLYIGEYNDEEIALENILFDPATGEMPGFNCDFLNANLEQSVNLYRMDKDENIELIVGDPTEMFPEGGMSGFGSGFDRHENQYIWRMQQYDGKLFVGTFDTSSLAEPIGQFSNGDILHMTKEEWLSQIQYLRELIEILTKDKASAEPQAAAFTLDEEVMTVEGSEAAEDVKNTAETVAAKEPEGTEEASEGMTAEEAPEAEKDVSAETEGEAAQQQTDAMIVDLCELTDDLEAGADALEMTDEISAYSSDDKNHFEIFYEYYKELKDRFEALDEIYDLPEFIEEAYQKILNNETLHKLDGVITCMNYLSTGTRGFDMYVTEDGVHFDTITINGFDDPYNHGLRVFAVNNQGLSIGTANPFYGTQVWIYKDLQVVTEGYEGIYDGKNHSITVKPTAENAVVSYSLETNGQYTTEIPQFKNAGEYTVYYKVTKDGQVVANGNESVIINPKDITDDKNVVVELGPTLVYDGNEKTQTVNKVYDSVLKEDITFNVADNTATDAGVHVLVIEGTGNYSGEISIKYVIIALDDKVDEIGKESDGKIEMNVFVDEKGPEAALKDSKSEMIRKVATADELSKVASGATLSIRLEIKDISDSISAESKKDIESKTKGYNVASYIDITLLKQLNNDGEPEKITKIQGEPIRIELKIPEELSKWDKAVIKREFAIVRNHMGMIDILPAAFNDVKCTLSFETDRFSDYGIIYKDSAIQTDSASGSGTNSNNGAEYVGTYHPTQTADAPKTGDSANAGAWIALLGICFLGIIGTAIYMKKYRK